jgi:hypothetical protein
MVTILLIVLALILIGASTGGPTAIRELLTQQWRRARSHSPVGVAAVGADLTRQQGRAIF